MFDYQLSLMTGVDIPIPELQLVMHQPSMTEISYLGEKNFLNALSHLCLRKERLFQDESLLQNLTNFQVLMKVIEQSETKNEKKQNIIDFLSILFPNHSPILNSNYIALLDNNTKKPVKIDSENFEIFQTIVSDVFNTQVLFKQDEEIVYNPAGEKAKRIAEKIYAGRRKIAEINSANNENKSILSRYISILTIGVSSMSLKDCLDLTIYQLLDLVERYSLYVDQDIDLRVRLAGGEPDSKVENWMKDIHSK